MKFFKSFYDSIFNFRFLAGQRANMKNGLGYFFILIFVVTLGLGSFVSWQTVKFYNFIKIEFQNQVPDFEADFKGGKLKVTRLEQPYDFEYAADKTEGASSVRMHIHIDTVSTSTLSAAESLDAFVKDKTDIVVIMNSKEVAYYNGTKSGQITINNFSEFPDVSFNKEKIKGFMEKAGRYMPIAIFCIFVVVYFSQAMSKLLFLAFFSLILLAISALAKKGWKYGELFSVGLFAITLPAIFSLFYFILNWRLPYAYIILYLVIMILVMFKVEGKKEEKSIQVISDNK